MIDERIKKVSKILVEHSTKVKKGDVVLISCPIGVIPLAVEVYRLCLIKGAFPSIHADVPGAGYYYYKLASDKQLRRFPKISYYEAKNTDVFIRLYGDYNTKEFSNVDPKKISARGKVTKKIKDTMMKKRWVIFEYPTNALAQDAEMSLAEFEDFVYGASIQDWKREERKYEKLKRILNKGKTVRIIGTNTDLTFSIKGRVAISAAGECNMPDGEVFTSVVENSANGCIEYDFPAIYIGNEVDGVRLEFKKGRVVKFSAEKNELFLKAMLNTDKGAKRLGEFGIGTNRKIKKFVKQILFDEKIGGTIHLALGESYKETKGHNKSAIHWDMIKDLRKDGELWIDEKLIMKNGKFKF